MTWIELFIVNEIEYKVSTQLIFNSFLSFPKLFKFYLISLPFIFNWSILSASNFIVVSLKTWNYFFIFSSNAIRFNFKILGRAGTWEGEVWWVEDIETLWKIAFMLSRREKFFLAIDEIGKAVRWLLLFLLVLCERREWQNEKSSMICQ